MNNYKLILFFIVGGLSAFLASCKNGPDLRLNKPQVTQNSSAPVQLGGSRNIAAAPTQVVSVRMPLDRAKVIRSIENYRINKKAQQGSYKFVGADLNGDGQAEVIVYLTGKKWCAPTGCTLVIFAPVNRYSYEPISTVRRVKKPVHIAMESTNGWRDIYIRAGLADWPKSHKIQLKFSGNRYPGNAVLLTPLNRRFQIIGEEIFTAATREELDLIRSYTNTGY
ncbi:MAG: hypothetical protein ACRBBN_18655 [Methyloligellaceae bacterium]